MMLWQLIFHCIIIDGVVWNIFICNTVIIWAHTAAHYCPAKWPLITHFICHLSWPVIGIVIFNTNIYTGCTGRKKEKFCLIVFWMFLCSIVILFDPSIHFYWKQPITRIQILCQYQSTIWSTLSISLSEDILYTYN